MLRVDKAIFDVDEVICENIKQFGPSNRGLLSQNILSQARNLVEYVAIKEYSHGQDVDPNDYNLRCDALKYMQRRGNLRFLYRFHEMLQKTVSHYTVDKDGSERLMLKYYEHFYRIRLFLSQKYKISILNNISMFPLNTDIHPQSARIRIRLCQNHDYKRDRRKDYAQHLLHGNHTYQKQTESFLESRN